MENPEPVDTRGRVLELDALNVLARTVEGDAIRVWILMLAMSDEKGLFSARIEDLAARMAPPMARRTFVRHYDQLVSRGCLEKVQRTGRGNVYLVKVPGREGPGVGAGHAPNSGAPSARSAPESTPSAASDPNSLAGSPPTTKVREYMLCQNRHISCADDGIPDRPNESMKRQNGRFRRAENGASGVPDRPNLALQKRQNDPPNSTPNFRLGPQNQSEAPAAAAQHTGNSGKAVEPDRQANVGGSGGEAAAAAGSARLLGNSTAQDWLLTHTLPDPITHKNLEISPKILERAARYDLERIQRNFNRCKARGGGWGLFDTMVKNDEAGEIEESKRAANDRLRRASPARGRPAAAALIHTGKELSARHDAAKKRIAAMDGAEFDRVCEEVLRRAHPFMAKALTKRRAEARTSIAWLAEIGEYLDKQEASVAARK